MAERKNHAQKAKAFSEAQKKKNTDKQRPPKTHLIPEIEWQSAELLELRGDVAEAIQNNLIAAYESLQRAGQAFQVLLNMNMKSGKVKLKYHWNNGDKVTEEELKTYEAQMKELQDLKAKQLKLAQEAIGQEAKDKEDNEKGTLLTTIDGRPLTKENLEETKSGLII